MLHLVTFYYEIPHTNWTARQIEIQCLSLTCPSLSSILGSGKSLNKSARGRHRSRLSNSRDAIVHVYISTAPIQRKCTFANSYQRLASSQSSSSILPPRRGILAAIAAAPPVGSLHRQTNPRSWLSAFGKAFLRPSLTDSSSYTSTQPK